MHAGTAAGRWLSSTKNITGSTLAVAAVAAEALVGLGAFWPVAVAGSYAIGALIAPRDKVSLGFDLAAGRAATVAELTGQVRSLRQTAATESRRLGEDAATLLLRTLDTLEQIAGRWSVVAASPEHSYTVERIAFEYLPTAVQGYLNLPRTFALAGRVEGKRNAHDELLDQLGVLDKETDRIRTAAYTQDLDALSVQTQFLRDKFAPSGLTIR